MKKTMKNATAAAGRFMKRQAKKVAVALGIGAGAVAGQASAAQDWTGVDTAIQGEITAVLPIALGIGGTIIAVSVAWRLLKRIGQ